MEHERFIEQPRRVMVDEAGRIMDSGHGGVGGHVKNMAFGAGRELLNDPIVKKEGKKMLRKAAMGGLKMLGELMKK